MQAHEVAGRLEDLNERECQELLASQVSGRLGVIFEGKPEIFPVNYALDAVGAIVFQTAPGTKLFATVNHHVVFEVDQMADPGVGWSVIVHGVAHQTDIDSLRFDGPKPHPWVSGRSDTVRIHSDRISGRKLVKLSTS